MRTESRCLLVLKEIAKSKLDYNIPVRHELSPLTGNRRFRWAYLVQKEFSSCFDHESMREVLENTPNTLEDTYANVLSKIPERYKKKARLMFMWLAYSIYPLRLRELASVASLPNPEAVLQICTSSLVSLDKDVVKFDHFSVKEYLVSEHRLASVAPTASSFYVPPMLAHLQIAGTCISTLLDPKLVNLIERYIRLEPDLYPDFRNGLWKLETGEDDILTIPPLLSYSQQWYLHVQEADSMSARSAQLNNPSLISESENLRDHIHKLFCDENHQSFRYWASGTTLFGKTREWLSPLHYASYMNLPDSVRRLFKPRSNPGEAMGVLSPFRREPQEHMTPLHVAGVRGHLEIVSLLLDSGMRITQSDFEDVIRRNERNGLDVMTSILEVQPDLSITDDAVRAAARNVWTGKFVEYFLNNGFLSSKARILLVLRVWYSRYEEPMTGLMKALVKHGKDIGCTGRDFYWPEPESLVDFALERYEPLSLSQDITKCIASDTPGGLGMVRGLCQKYKDISFSQDQLADAAKWILVSDSLPINHTRRHTWTS